MYFNSYIFILAFLPIVLCGYYLINKTKKYRLGQMWLLAASLMFIGYLNTWYTVFAALCICIGYLFLICVTNKDKRVRIIGLTAGLLFHIGNLLYFKYCNFFIENLNVILADKIPLRDIVLPIGISFYTFQQIAYLVDCYRDLEIKADLLEYALYISFFPQFLQGPILLHEDMLPSLRNQYNKAFSAAHFSKGLYAFALGLGKKVLLADNIAYLVNTGYANISELNTPSALLTMTAYSLQLYFDFSGYCDMAVGLGEMFQIYMPANFNSPYKAVSVTDIWSRWHITLTRFFTKYVYIPLGGNRKGSFRMYLNTFFVFLISGLWHGAAWTFILWGILHGVAMVCSKLLKRCRIVLPKVIGWTGTFLFWVFSFAIFRASSLEEAKLLFGQFLNGGMGRIHPMFTEALENQMEVSVLQKMDFIGILEQYPEMTAVLLVLLPLISCLIMRNTQEKLQEFRYTYGKLFVTAILIFVSILSFTGVNVFLYSNF